MLYHIYNYYYSVNDNSNSTKHKHTLADFTVSYISY